jgi:hypothetical protein
MRQGQGDEAFGLCRDDHAWRLIIIGLCLDTAARAELSASRHVTNYRPSLLVTLPSHYHGPTVGKACPMTSPDSPASPETLTSPTGKEAEG